MTAAGAAMTLGLVAAILAGSLCCTAAAPSQGSQGPCSHVTSDAEFRLTSPLYPARYPRNYSCTYVVRRRTPAACQLQLTFDFFDVGDCAGDVLDVGGQAICGRVSGVRRFPLDQEGVTLSFRSGPYSTGGGFNVAVQQVSCATNRSLDRASHCGGEFSSPTVLLASPQALRSYTNQTSCLYIIRPVSQQFCQLEISYSNFSLQSSHDCVKERLEIEGQGVLCGVVTGSRRYHWINNEVRIWFVTDSDSTGSGFEIILTQLPCYADSNMPKFYESPRLSVKASISAKNYHIQTQQSTEYPSLSPTLHSQLCCDKIYSDKVFIITSPGFPKSIQRNNDCIFVIRQHNSDICRLRMTLKYFCVGKEDSYVGCYGGYLEIDGHRICGCQTGRTLTSVFSSTLNQGQKILKYVPSEEQGLSFGGFVIEIVQEACFVIVKRSPHNSDLHHADTWNTSLARIEAVLNRQSVDTKVKYEGEYRVMGKKNNALQISNENSIIINDSSENYQHAVLSENHKLELFAHGKRARRSPYGSNFWQCNLKTWVRLVEELFRKTAGRSLCPIPQPLNCQVTYAEEGILQSPNYPGAYPANLRCCYRIARRAGYCRVQLTMLDFDVELSAGCVKDFIVLGNSGRYCGASLAATTSYLDLTERNHADLLFVTDVGGAARGFRAAFRQLPCSATGPSTTTTTAWPPSYNCGDVLRGQQFYLYSSRYNLALSACTFTIPRVSQDVCELQISMERFNLTCGQESLQIGTQFYCGPLTGNFASTKFNGNEVQIVYRKSTADNPGEFVIRGQQVADCEPLTLHVTPAARSHTVSCAVQLRQPGGDRTFPGRGDPADCSYVFEHHTGICKLRLNFDQFETRSTEGCLLEFLELEGRKFCGSQLLNHSRDILFNGSDIRVPYLVEESPKTSNWHFSYNYLAC